MMRQRYLVLVTAAGLLLTTACATNFSAPGVHAEIERQTGASPREALSVSAGPLTMALARKFLDTPTPAGIPLSGSRVSNFEIAVYELAPKAGAETRALDFTLMPFRGWEPALRFRSGDRSGMVLVRSSGDAFADLVILVSDSDGAIYGRLSGTLSKELAARLASAVQSGGTEAVKRELETMPNEK